VLTVSTWKEADLTGEVVIRPDGGLSFPLAGEVHAAGESVEQVRAEIESRLRRFVPEAVVSVLLKLPQGYRIYVIGKVNKPGDFMLNRPTDVMQALALAGGATPFADVDDIKILRRDASRQTAISFHYSDVSRGKSLHQNVVLQGGDTVVVP
jgi:polysaccharide export outer membrane protein